MAYLSTAVRCTCAKWRQLTDDQKVDRRWIMAHQLCHNLAAGRPPFTVSLFMDRAECSERDARTVLDEAAAMDWFTLIPASAFGPECYQRPFKRR
jgi:hypothetical protein